MLFAVSAVKIENITSVLGDRVTFPCYSADATVEWRCSSHKYKNSLIYGYANILTNATEFLMTIGRGWYNLTMDVLSSDDTQCDCFKADGGPLIKQYMTTVVAGNV